MQRSVATNLILGVVDQHDNQTYFPPGAAVYCTLRYPSDKEAPYSSDGHDVLPTLRNSTIRGVEGQMNETREGKTITNINNIPLLLLGHINLRILAQSNSPI